MKKEGKLRTEELEKNALRIATAMLVQGAAIIYDEATSNMKPEPDVLALEAQVERLQSAVNFIKAARVNRERCGRR